MVYKLFCDRCNHEIEQAPTSEIDEVEITMRKPETGEDAVTIGTICNRCYVDVFLENKPWKILVDEVSLKEENKK